MAEQKADPALETDQLARTAIAQDPREIKTYTGWLEELEEAILNQMRGPAPELMARLELMRVQTAIEKTPLADARLLRSLKNREKEILDQWGQTFTQKDLSAAGFTEEQTKNVVMSWVPFKGGLSLLLHRPEFLKNVVATQAVMLPLSLQGNVYSGALDAIEYNRITRDLEHSDLTPANRAQHLPRYQPNIASMLDGQFWGSGAAIDTLLMAGITGEEKDNAIFDFTSSVELINASNIKSLIRVGANIGLHTDIDGRNVALLNSVNSEVKPLYRISGDSEQWRLEPLQMLQHLLREAGARTTKDIRKDPNQVAAPSDLTRFA